MVLKRPLQIFNGFWGDHHHWMFLGGLTIAINGFTMVFWCCYHRFQWFSMVPDHWSNDAMVLMDRCGLIRIIFQPRIALASQISDDNDGSRIYICVCVPPPCSGSVLPIYLNGIFFIWIEYVESRTSYYIPSSANRQSFPRYQEIALDRYIYFSASR